LGPNGSRARRERLSRSHAFQSFEPMCEVILANAERGPTLLVPFGSHWRCPFFFTSSSASIHGIHNSPTFLSSLTGLAFHCIQVVARLQLSSVFQNVSDPLWCNSLPHSFPSVSPLPAPWCAVNERASTVAALSWRVRSPSLPSASPSPSVASMSDCRC
jgi:hypothetical protein